MLINILSIQLLQEKYLSTKNMVLKPNDRLRYKINSVRWHCSFFQVLRQLLHTPTYDIFRSVYRLLYINVYQIAVPKYYGIYIVITVRYVHFFFSND